jgi:hypoxanthine phosphoribosyltransferase
VTPEPLFSEAQIREAVQGIARRISSAYRGETPLLIGVLRGSFVFLADLVRELTIPFEVDFMRARSYGAGLKSRGSVEISKDVETEVRGRHVLIVEDIADTGLTMRAIVERVSAGKPASVKRCALLVRKGCESVEYGGLEVEPGFVVGYGIDYAEAYRGLRDIRVLPDTK